MIGMWLAQQAPQRLDRLVLSNTAARVDPSTFDERIRLIRSQGMPAIVDTILGRFFTAGYLARRTVHAATVRSTLLGIEPDGYAGCCAAIRDMDIAKGLAGIATPTLVIAGSFDPSTPAARGREIAQTVPGARYPALPTAHFGHSERPRRSRAVLIPAPPRSCARGRGR